MAHRRPVLAGSWYPATASRCQATIEQFQSEEPVTPAQAGIVPHAGWDYSGAIAWGVFEALAAAEPQPQLLVLFGTHMGPRSRPHVSRTDAFETPLGPITAARELAETLARLLPRTE